jgi:hypothetical protein
LLSGEHRYNCAAKKERVGATATLVKNFSIHEFIYASVCAPSVRTRTRIRCCFLSLVSHHHVLLFTLTLRAAGKKSSALAFKMKPFLKRTVLALLENIQQTRNAERIFRPLSPLQIQSLRTISSIAACLPLLIYSYIQK